ncbi:hypothetical protein B5M09_012253, partial [Aphanomyces astaci]
MRNELATWTAQLAAAREALSIRGLSHAASFACELYASLPLSVRENASSVQVDHSAAPSDGLLLLAKSYMDLQEYARASHVLGQKQGALTDVEFFVLHYARYLAGERRKEQLSMEMKTHSGWIILTFAASFLFTYHIPSHVGASQKQTTSNPHLKDLLRDLADADASPNQLDAFGLYLYAVVLKQAGFEHTTVHALYVQLLQRSLALF